jgi:hypothetical protein
MGILVVWWINDAGKAIHMELILRRRIVFHNESRPFPKAAKDR